MNRLYTIGYQRLPLSRLVEIVNELDALLVDCRLKPYSWNADFRRDKLQTTFGKRYIWKGKDLGGFNHTTAAGIDWIREERGKRVLLLLCMESNPLDCHRHHAICSK